MSREKGIDVILLETHNWGKSVAFWKGLGYAIDFETDHHSGRLVHPAGGPSLFIAERPHGQPLRVVPGISVQDATKFAPPSSGSVKTPFTKEHWGMLQMLLLDPDGREVAVEAPLVPDAAIPAADPTAVRTALWRALHVELDARPHVIEDQIGLCLAAPSGDWRQRPDMHPQGTSSFRASIVARARFIEDTVEREVGRGVEQYVILGAGLDTFAQRRSDLTKSLRVFEIDRPGPQAWKKQRLAELGFGVPHHLTFVPVDFEAGHSWREELRKAGLDATKPALVVSTGVSMYLTKEANMATLRDAASFAKGSTFVMSFLQPIQLAEESARAGLEQSAKGARASGTPFISFFTTEEIRAMAREAGFADGKHVSAASLGDRYFSDRSDGLRPPVNGEELLVATTSVG